MNQFKNGTIKIQANLIYFYAINSILGRIRINTICLPLNSDASETWEDYDATVAGWGSTDTLDGGHFGIHGI